MQIRKTGLLFAVLCFLFIVAVQAQDTTYVKWIASCSKVSDGIYSLHLKTTLDKGWHIYTKDNQPEGVSSLKISFADSSIKPQGEPALSGSLKTIKDKIFDNKPADVAEGSIELIQKIILL